MIIMLRFEHLLRFFEFLIHQQRIYAININLGISTSNLVIANFAPRAVISNRIRGIFVVDHAPIKISTLLNFTPFFINTAATGNACLSF